MDWGNVKDTAVRWLRKYRMALLVLGAGIFLMAIPQREEKQELPEPETVENTQTMEQRLEEILTCIAGAGRVRVLLTERTGESILYQTDEDSQTGADSASTRTGTVVISGSDRGEQGLVRQINPPAYLGAVVVCQGGEDPSVRLAIVEAVANATGLGTDRISVLKMK